MAYKTEIKIRKDQIIFPLFYAGIRLIKSSFSNNLCAVAFEGHILKMATVMSCSHSSPLTLHCRMNPNFSNFLANIVITFTQVALTLITQALLVFPDT
jgi:hypothetical protein